MDLNLYPIWTALVTPFDSNLKIDFKSLEKLLKSQENANNGVLILGSTGESLNMSFDEKIEILKFVESLKLKIPIMCGVPGINLPETLKWIDAIEKFKIDLYLMVTPLYAKPGEKGQYHWFKTLLDHASKPSILYNVPSRTGTSLNINAVKNLNSHPNFYGIKEASGSTKDFKDYIEAAGGKKLYSGDDGMCPQFCPLGAFGVISVASNIWPLQTKKYFEKCLKQNLSPEEQNLWENACDALFISSNPIPVKRILQIEGMIETPEARPPLSADEDYNHQTLKDANINVTDWYRSIKE